MWERRRSGSTWMKGRADSSNRRNRGFPVDHFTPPRSALPYFGAGSHYRLGARRISVPQHLFSKLLSWHEMSFIIPAVRQLFVARFGDERIRSQESGDAFTSVATGLGHAARGA